MLSGVCSLPDIGILCPKSVSIKGALMGFAAQFTIRQVFQHDESKPTEMAYGLPDNMKLCMFDLSFHVGDEVIKPVIQRIDEAEMMNWEAKDEFRSVVIARRFPGFVEIRLGCIPGGVEVVVEATFGVFASNSGLKDLFIRLPIQRPNCTKRNPMMNRAWHSLTTAVPCSFEFDCSNAGYDVTNASINCPSEVYCKASRKLSIADISDQEGIVIAVTRSESLHNDFFVSGQYMALSFFGSEVSGLQPANNEFVFVVDCSGSMACSRINSARDCMDIFLRSLPAGSYFNILRFGSTFQCFSERSVEYNQENFEKAIAYANALDANLGGTQLFPVLSHIFSSPCVGSGDRQLFIITDGVVEDAFKVLDLCETYKDHNRIFTLGIGAHADIGIVEGLADMTGGRSAFISDSEDFSSKVTPQLESSFYPPTSLLSIQVEGHDAIELSCPCLREASINGVMHVVVKSQKAFTGHEAVLINATCCGESVDVPITSNHSPKNDSGFSRLVHALFHFEQIRYLERVYRQLGSAAESESERQLVEQQIVSLSQSSGILSEFTEFVGIRARNLPRVCYSVSPSDISIPIIGAPQSPAPGLGQCAETVQLHRKKAKSSCWGGGGGFIRMRLAAKSNEAKAPASVVPIDGFTFKTVTSLQHMLGYWVDVSSIFQTIGKVLHMPESLKMLDGISDEDKANAFNTVAAIAILRHWFVSDHASWSLIERKALSWLASVSKDMDWECLIQEVLSRLT